MSRFEPVLMLGLGADPAADPSTWSRTDASGYIRWKTLSFNTGRPDEAPQTDPSKATCVFDNRDNRFSRRNPLGAWYGQLRKDTPMWIQLRRVRDGFGRTVSNAWGSPDYGPAWTTAGGSAADYSVSAGYGKHTVAATNSFRYTVAGVSLKHPDVTATVNVAALATGASLRAALVSRYQDVSNYYYAEVILNTDQTISINVGKNVAGVFTQLATSSTTGVTHTVGRRLRVRFRTYGTTVSAKVWDESLAEPSGWQVTATDSAILVAGKVGCRSLRATGNTNGTTTFNFDDVAVVADLWTGWVPQWTPRWDKSVQDSTVPIEGAGVLRRYTQGEQPTYSPLRHMRRNADNLLAYWSVEDEPDAAQAASEVGSVAPMQVAGSVNFGGWPAATSLGGTVRFGTSDLADIKAGGKLVGVIPPTTGTEWTVQVFTGNLDGVSDLTILEWETPGGTYARWRFSLNWSTSTGRVQGVTAGGTATTVASGVIFSGTTEFYIDAIQNGADVDVRLWYTGDLIAASGTAAANTLAMPTVVTGNPNGSTTSAQWPFGQVVVWSTRNPPRGGPFIDSYGGPDYGLLLSSFNEVATTRLARLVAEDDVRFSLAEPITDNTLITRMDSQQPGRSIDLYRLCETTDYGILYEDDHGLAYLPRAARYNRIPDLVTTFDRLDQVPLPSDDDQAYRTHIEVSRPGGSSAVAVSQTYETGQIIRTEKVDVIVSADSRLPDQAAFRVHVASVDEYRWTEITINFAANTDLVDQFLNCRPGSRIQITGAPGPVLGSDIDAVLEGWQVERFTPDELVVTFNLTPYSPWLVFQLDSATYGRLAFAGQTLNGAHNASTTALSVATVAGKPLVTTAGGDMPYTVAVDGEQMAVTAASGASSPQTLTATRGTNLDGAGTSHDSGAVVQLANPACLAL